MLQVYNVCIDLEDRDINPEMICLDKKKTLNQNDRYQLRIDNSRRGRIHSLWDISRTTKATTSCEISNERAAFRAYVDVSGL